MPDKDTIKNLLKLKKDLDRICEEDELNDPIFAKAAELEELAWESVYSKKNYAPEKAIKRIEEAAKLHHEFKPNQTSSQHGS
jgi:hypothetical protein